MKRISLLLGFAVILSSCGGNWEPASPDQLQASMDAAERARADQARSNNEFAAQSMAHHERMAVIHTGQYQSGPHGGGGHHAGPRGGGHGGGHGGGRGQCRAMSASDFNTFQSTVNGKSFDDGKLEMVDMVTRSGACFSVNQVMQVLKLFSFDTKKADACVMFYKTIVDPQNWYQVSNAFTFSSNWSTCKSKTTG